ncbi:MAG: hypothetical protein JSW15_04995, partial [Deltaproteobacteria bacterium]
MPDKKEDKPGADKSSFADSGELFETLFREELEAIKTDKPKKVAPETDAKAKKVIKKKPVAPVQVDTPK